MTNSPIVDSILKSLSEVAKKQNLECKIPQKQETSKLEDKFKLIHNIITTIECIDKNLENKDPTEIKPYAKHLAILHNPDTIRELTIELTHELNFDTLSEELKPEFVDELYEKFNKATLLYAQIMQGLIRVLFKKDIKKMAKVMEIVENRKNVLLSLPYKIKPEIKRDNNPLLSRFGLVPATGMLTIKDILERAAVELQIKTGSKNFRELHKNSGCGVILLYKLTTTPIEIRSHQLLYPNTQEELEQSAQKESHPGISKELVQKYNTIVELSNKNKKWDFSGEIIHGKTTERYLVVETLDQTNFRVLAPWINAKSGGIILGKFRVERLIAVLENDKIQPTRSTLYNRNLNYATCSNMFLKKPIELNAYGKFTDVPSHKLFQNVSLKLTARMTKNWGRTKKLGKMELNDLFHDPEYAEIFKKCIMENYKDICSDDVTNASKVIFGEIFTSFLIEIERSAIKLMKELHDAYLKLPAEFEKQECEDLFLKILGMILKPHDNIYAALEYKNYLFLMTSLTNIKKVKAKEQAKEFFDL